MTPKPSPDTVSAQGSPTPGHDSALVPPIVYSAAFAARDAQEFAAMASQPRHARYYTRYGNPLHEQVAAQVAALEGGGADTHDALLTASGMGAISLVLLGLLKAGDHVVAQTNHYMASAKHSPSCCRVSACAARWSTRPTSAHGSAPSRPARGW